MEPIITINLSTVLSNTPFIPPTLSFRYINLTTILIHSQLCTMDTQEEYLFVAGPMNVQLRSSIVGLTLGKIWTMLTVVV